MRGSKWADEQFSDKIFAHFNPNFRPEREFNFADRAKIREIKFRGKILPQRFLSLR